MTQVLLMMGQGKGGGIESIMLLGFSAILFFFFLRPQSKKQKEQKEFTANIKVGDKVVTIGGIHGTIIKINDDGSYKLEGERNTIFTIENTAVSMDMTKLMQKRSTK
jgi:preprotein translocase subunit YajC